jgi:hypothetical protein
MIAANKMTPPIVPAIIPIFVEDQNWSEAVLVLFAATGAGAFAVPAASAASKNGSRIRLKQGIVSAKLTAKIINTQSATRPNIFACAIIL